MSRRTDLRIRKRAKRTRAGPIAPFPLSWSLVLLALVLAFTAAVRIRLLNVPLERDEGEYAYAGQLLLQGIPPYSLAYNMKLPGVYVAYALILAAFGQSSSAIRWGLLLWNAAAIVLVFAVARRLLGSFAAVAAAASYAILSISPSVVGLAAHATHFVIVPALGGVLLLLKADESPRRWTYFWSGVLLGLAFVMKQHGMAFILFGLFHVLSGPLRNRRTAWRDALVWTRVFSAGAVLPFALTCLIMLAEGVFDRFWFWTFSYAREYVAEIPITYAWKAFVNMIPKIVGPASWLWIVAGAGVVVLWWMKERRAHALFLSSFLASSFLGVCPGFLFREHYFILLLPALAILVGAAVAATVQYLAAKRLPTRLCYGVVALLLAMALAQPLLRQRDLLFQLTPYQVSRSTYGLNPFPEAVEISRYISAHSKPTDRIAILGSEPEIFFYSSRRSATGHIYTYGLMERQPYAKQMQQEMVREIEAARPEYLVSVNIWTSWLRYPDSETFLFDWAAAYSQEHYRLVGIVEILPSGDAVYRWDADALGYVPHSEAVIHVLRRR